MATALMATPVTTAFHENPDLIIFPGIRPAVLDLNQPLASQILACPLGCAMQQRAVVLMGCARDRTLASWQLLDIANGHHVIPPAFLGKTGRWFPVFWF